MSLHHLLQWYEHIHTVGFQPRGPGFLRTSRPGFLNRVTDCDCYACNTTGAYCTCSCMCNCAAFFQVNLTNNCGPERECVTDFALSFNSVQYLPDRSDSPLSSPPSPFPAPFSLLSPSLSFISPLSSAFSRGLNYETIEVGGVNEVIVQLTLSNNGDEDAIVLLLDISHSVEDVFTDQVEIMINVCMAMSSRSLRLYMCM